MAAKKSSGVFVSWPKPMFQYIVKTNKNFRSYYQGALMYAHYELTTADLKKEVVKRLKSMDAKHPLLEKIKDIHENRFGTIGKYMYILNHNCDLPEDIENRVMPFLEKIVNEEEAKALEEQKSSKYFSKETIADPLTEAVTRLAPTIQDRLREKAHEAAGEVEGWLDDLCVNRKLPVKTVQDFVNLFKSFELKAPHARLVNSFFERRATEIQEAIDGKNKDLNEGYSRFTKPELKKLGLFYTNLTGACVMLQEVAKVARAPKAKKPVSQDKLVSKLKYKKDDSALGIVSLSPVQILGAKEAWVYNTKTRKLAQYKSSDERGLLVKGSALLNYSSDSVEKTLRKPAEQLAEFKKASKVKLRTFIKDLATVDVPASGRTNEHCIILRIDK